MNLKIKFLCFSSTVAGFNFPHIQKFLLHGVGSYSFVKSNTFSFRLYENWNSSDVEAARERLESTIGAFYDSQPKLSPPPMTITQQKRREHEINLIMSLEKNDEAANKLWEHWFNERGAGPAQKLEQTSVLISSGPEFWSEAEEKLMEIIEEHGDSWVEPMNRLATLKFLQGKNEESKSLCLKVLDIKPWHFGALSGIILVFTRLKENNMVNIWAGRRLPPLQPPGENIRREEWVLRAVNDATTKLRDDIVIDTGSDDTTFSDEIGDTDDAWQ